MADAELSQFQCDQCGRRFRWSAAAAGRRVRCPCGAAVTCPADDPSSDMYDLTAADAPAKTTPIAATTPAAAAQPQTQPPAPIALAYRNAKTEPSRGKAEPETIKNLYMP